MGSISTRPDGRRFVSLADGATEDHVAWLQMATTSCAGALHLQCRGADTALIAAATECGFVTETESSIYRVPFAGLPASHVRGRPRDVHHQHGTELVTADEVDPDALFRLDERLRGDVPGLDGWIGRRDWFDDEFASAEFDPSAYLVAQETTSERLVGLVRFWRTTPIPKLGLLGVLPEYRNRYLSYQLLMAGLDAAQRWGHSHFETHTARLPLQHRMERLGAVQTGTFVQMVSQSPER